MSLMSRLPPQAPVPFVRLLRHHLFVSFWDLSMVSLHLWRRVLATYKKVLFAMFNIPGAPTKTNNGTRMCTPGCEKGLEES